jgi:hypothetical protein
VSGIQAPGNAPGLSSRVVGEKTLSTDSLVDVQPAGGSCFAAAHADTMLYQQVELSGRSLCLDMVAEEDFGIIRSEQCTHKKPALHHR